MYNTVKWAGEEGEEGKEGENKGRTLKGHVVQCEAMSMLSH